MISFILNQKDS